MAPQTERLSHLQTVTFESVDGSSARQCIEAALADHADSLAPASLKAAIAKLDDSLAARFESGELVDRLVYARARGIDALLIALWKKMAPTNAARRAALIAVGGYGRGELAPASDVDIMIVVDSKRGDHDWIARFVTSLWDSGLEIGHSVRTPSECKKVAKDDLTIITTMMESRLLVGNHELLDKVRANIRAEKMWSSKKFFAAKRSEQITRHARYDDTAYNLEPNVKGSPGGLRDIQMIGWVANRHFGSSEYEELVDHKFLTPGQLKLLMQGRSFLWRVRFGLHLLTGRAENRLLFDHQKQLATLLGYEDASTILAVEQMMQRYYRTVADLSRLNEMLLQLFEEAILLNPDAKPVILDSEFQLRNGYLQTADDSVFANNPSALLRLFQLLQQHADVRGVSAYTVGLIKRNLHLIDDEFRQSPKNHRLFLELLSAERGVTTELRRMNLYGVLGLYLPAFGRIVGRMQYDLFHAYTVDEHTLFVVSYLRKLALGQLADELPHATRVMQQIERKELAYLSGLFHDIGKGRGGDHSKLGAVDAEAFCIEHGLGPESAELISWLVRHHLLHSMTAQKKDLSDPAVVQKYAEIVKTPKRLAFLYVLTVADVRGTNPRLWNTWKASLFRELYELTLQALNRGLDDPAQASELGDLTRVEASQMLRQADQKTPDIEALWADMPAEYFSRYRAEEIAWHTEVLLASGTQNPTSAVAIKDQALSIFLYTDGRYHTFAHTTAVLDELGLDIEDARIVPSNHQFSLDMYTVANHGATPAELKQCAADVENRLARVVERSRDPDSEWQPRVTRRLSRQARMFDTETQVRFVGKDEHGRTVMELDTADRPGLLSLVGEIFVALGVDIAMAKIVTIGEKAEDVFHISDLNGNALSESAQADLTRDLIRRLSQASA